MNENQKKKKQGKKRENTRLANNTPNYQTKEKT